MHGTPVELMKQPDALQLLTPMLRADFEAIETHRYDPLQPPLDCPILALGGLADPNVDRAELEGWARHTRSRFEAKYFRGDHFFIFNQQKPVTTCISREILSIIAGSHA